MTDNTHKNFTYSAEKGYTLNCEMIKVNSVNPMTNTSWGFTCETCPTNAHTIECTCYLTCVTCPEMCTTVPTWKCGNTISCC